METNLSTLLTTEMRYDSDVSEETFGKRLASVMKKAGISKAKAATWFGVTEQSVRRYIKEETPADFLGVILLCQRAGVDPFWLAFGTKRPLPFDEADAQKAVEDWGISLLADLRKADEPVEDRIDRLEARADLLTEMIAILAHARAESLAQELADEAAEAKRERTRSSGK